MVYLRKTDHIGNVQLNGRILLSPMAGYTDVAFRTLCARYGAGLVVTEFISSNTIVNADLTTLRQVQTSSEEKPLAFQLFGNDIDLILKASKIIETKCDLININMGCPAPNIVQQGSGSAMLENPELIGNIIKKLVDNLSVPVTIKIRAGVSKENINAVAIAKIAEKNGCAAICIHPRTQQQGYKGDADWDIIRQIKDAVTIPIIGNGGVIDELTAEKMFQETNCDFIMIGRAALGDPMIFKRINHYLETKVIIKQTPEEIMREKITLFLEYYDLWKQFNLPFIVLKEHSLCFTSGFSGAATIRGAISKIKDEVELIHYFNQL